MEFDFDAIFIRLQETIEPIVDSLVDPFTVFQLVLILAFYLISLVLARRTEPSLENQARKIKNSPGLLRLIVTFLKQLEWSYFVVLIGALLSVLENMEWPSTSFLYGSLLLSASWLLITVLTQSIRSRTIRRSIALSAWFYVALVILGIDANVSVMLDAAGLSIGNFRFSLLLIIKIVVTLGFGLWASISLSNFIDHRLQRNEDMAPGLRILVAKILRITLLVIASAMAISAIGIDLTVLSVFTGAIGVGIGFGLQKVVSNFISGLIILADRSIKPGDTISLGETFGWIRELRARFISVVTRDGREYLIPNEDFITREVINWSFSDDLVRLEVKFGVAYDSDPHVVTKLACETAVTVPRVVKDQPPACWMTNFGDSSLDFVLRFWIRDPQVGLTNLRGEMLIALWDTFKEHGVNIPYPHRQLVFSGTPEFKLAGVDHEKSDKS